MGTGSPGRLHKAWRSFCTGTKKGSRIVVRLPWVLALMMAIMAKGYLSLAIIMSATFLPLISMPPKMGPMRGVPETAEEAIPQTKRPG